MFFTHKPNKIRSPQQWKQDIINPVLDDPQNKVVPPMLHSSQWNSQFISITIAITDFSNTPGVSPEANTSTNLQPVGNHRFRIHPSSQVSLWNDFYLPKPDHQLIEETMASIHDQLRCCLWIPRTNNKHQQHTHEIQDRDRRSTVGVNIKPRPTVSANPHPPTEDKRVRQAKLSSASTTHSPKTTFVVSKFWTRIHSCTRQTID